MKGEVMTVAEFLERNPVGVSSVTFAKWIDRNIEKLSDCVVVLRGSVRTTRRITDEKILIEKLRGGK